MANTSRIRDPVHDLIEFDCRRPKGLDALCWNLIQTPYFQRLRRVKQLGFSEFVYLGATHTRLSHSIGVFETARKIRTIIDRLLGDDPDQQAGNAAITAALVHDLGHGPFSHAFEEAMAELGVKRRHELWTVEMIKSEQISSLLEAYRPQFTEDVVRVISTTNKDIYDSIISSQFDADRLDYMRRDRMMTGTQQGVLDLGWLMANMEVRDINVALDDEVPPEKARALVLGKKSIQAAEAYVLGLFQLYQTVYLHKTTRGVEKLFSAFLVKLGELVRDEKIAATGLSTAHPLIGFLKNTGSLPHYAALDDTAVWGALGLARTADNHVLSQLASRILDRKIFKPIDVSGPIGAAMRRKYEGEPRDIIRQERDKLVAKFKVMIADIKSKSKPDELPLLLEDVADRNPYKRRRDAKTGHDIIWVADSNDGVKDLGELSDVVASLVPFTEYRVYVRDPDLRTRFNAEIQELIK